MQVLSSLQRAASIEATWLAVGVFENDPEPPAALRETEAAGLIARLIEAKDLSGKLGDTTPIPGASGLAAGSLLLVGLGTRESFDAGSAFSAGVAISRKLAGRPGKRVAVVVPEPGGPETIASTLLEGLIVGTRGSDLRKSEPARHPYGELVLVAHGAGPEHAGPLDRALRRGEIVGGAVNLARDLVNTPPSDLSPRIYAERARAEAEAAGLSVEVWDRPRIQRERFGGLLGVARGSNEPPAFVTLGLRQGGDSPTLALVGKGVTFDSGGLSLKPSASMEDMKSDMAGSATVLATMIAAARLALPVNLTGYLALTENMAGGSALKLGDVLTMRNGKTVEVLNTDAEGRLILADALSYAAEQAPGRILDLATLTGACVVALGTRIAGLFSTDDPFALEVQAACESTGERAWRMPLDDDFDEQLKSSVADLKNVGTKWGGAVTAAKFLQRFVGETPWVHLDIAGPSWTETESSTRDAGGTGCFVRTLVALLAAGTNR